MFVEVGGEVDILEIVAGGEVVCFYVSSCYSKSQKA